MFVAVLICALLVEGIFGNPSSDIIEIEGLPKGRTIPGFTNSSWNPFNWFGSGEAKEEKKEAKTEDSTEVKLDALHKVVDCLVQKDDSKECTQLLMDAKTQFEKSKNATAANAKP